jgi:hypothetical protein
MDYNTHERFWTRDHGFLQLGPRYPHHHLKSQIRPRITKMRRLRSPRPDANLPVHRRQTPWSDVQLDRHRPARQLRRGYRSYASPVRHFPVWVFSGPICPRRRVVDLVASHGVQKVCCGQWDGVGRRVPLYGLVGLLPLDVMDLVHRIPLRAMRHHPVDVPISALIRGRVRS